LIQYILKTKNIGKADINCLESKKQTYVLNTYWIFIRSNYLLFHCY